MNSKPRNPKPIVVAWRVQVLATPPVTSQLSTPRWWPARNDRIGRSTWVCEDFTEKSCSVDLKWYENLFLTGIRCEALDFAGGTMHPIWDVPRSSSARCGSLQYCHGLLQQKQQMEAGRQRQILFGILYIMHWSCCRTGRLSLFWSKSATSHCSPVLQLDYKPKCFCPLKLKTFLTKVSCSTAIAGCRTNPLEATQPISENPKFWSNQTGLTSCLKWLSWIWISFFECVKSCMWEILDWSFREDQIPHWCQSSFSKRFYLTPLFLWHVWRPR